MPGYKTAQVGVQDMKYVRFLSLPLAAVLFTACDNGASLQTAPDGGEQGVEQIAEQGAEQAGEPEGIETIDFFGAEESNSATIPYEPELGFALPARGILSVNTALIGSSTDGTDYRQDCAAGRVLVGLEGFASGDRVSQVGARCVEANAAGDWVGTAQAQANPVGITSGNPFNLDCEAGHAVTGITGVTRNNAVASVQIHCAKLDGPTSTNGDSKDSNVIGVNDFAIARQLCGSGAVATGIQGRANNEMRGLGLVCYESPATAGRWGNPFNWPVQAVHAIMTPQGDIMSYGFRDGSGNLYDYDVWKPDLGTADASHTTFASDQGVFSFCNASIVMPANGNILMPGGTKLNSDNAGVADVPIYDTVTGGLSRAPDMANRRWYPTTVTLPDGEILVAGGRDVAGVAINTPEIYSPEANQWRSLFGANMAGLDWSYPRLWVAGDGRVFGISRNEMYYINPLQSGALQRVGSFSAEFQTHGEGTAVMYRPGKILQVGGNIGGGTNAVVIDINGPSPVVREVEDMGVSRSAWSSSQVLADGKVMISGGSRLVNDAVTAALNPEIWDPDTEEWTVLSGFKWPRLYHSNSILLKDATVMIAGGGNPGPVTNYNAEIFSPPYLFNDDGSPAVRPEITGAPEQGAYGQQITLNTRASEVSKVTFVKTSAVTHSFNVEQRYMELPFSSNDNGTIQVGLPVSPNVATPGFYMMFVVNESGTPSEAAIIKLGDEPGVNPEPPVVQPEPPVVQVDNILVNGGFEAGKNNWLDCSDASLSVAGGRPSNGTQALSQNTGACLYQEFAVQPGETYTVSCDAFTQGSAYSSISLNILDAGYNELLTESSVVTETDYTAYGQSLTAPQNAAFAAVTLYSEGPTWYDSCVVTTDGTVPVVTAPVTPPPATDPVVVLNPGIAPGPTVVTVPDPTLPASNVLVNSNFTEGKASWYDCANTQLTTVESDAQSASNVLKVENAGCIYQEFPVTVGKQYKLECLAKSEGSMYSSISFQMADATYNQLESDVSVVAPGEFQTYTATLTAPATSATSAVTLYSEDITRVSFCSVEEM